MRHEIIMIDHPVICYNSAPEARSREPLAVGVPLARGVLQNADGLTLNDDQGNPLPVQTRPLSCWPDGSIKWLLCDFLADLPSSRESVFRLSADKSGKELKSRLQVVQDKDTWRVLTGPAEFHIDCTILRPFLEVRAGNREVLTCPAEILLIDAENHTWTPQIDVIQLETAGPVKVTLKMQGGFRNSRAELLRFEARLHFYDGTARTTFEIRLHNPRAARHPGNLWDLGDPASVILHEWALTIPLAHIGKPALLLKPSGTEKWRELGAEIDNCLYQESSGGKNWDSPVHRNRHGIVPLSCRGWRLTAGEKILAEGLRAQPTAWWGTKSRGGSSASIDGFWQRFPKSVALNRENIRLSLLPAEFPDGQELQGGEQWTETIRFDFDAPSDRPGWGYPVPLIRCAPDVYRASGIFTDGLPAPREDGYMNLLSAALDDQTGFIAKREKVDEYGWRNFGDLYADHESAFYKGEAPFISHYNNQYDVLASFYRQYLAGGDLRWGEMARDLAAHVADIDLNHTDEDREEYCHGLFWHTDHYLDAGLSTHRMASREHLTQKNPAFCGGGPAAEHGYASGLTLHYLMTGDSRFREAVLHLADWSWRSLNGAQTVGASLLRTAKSLAHFRHERKNKPIWPRFPFSRGTGNCLNISLDALDLTGDHGYLKRCEKMIQGAIHPSDRPEDRDLLNAEASWSYLVFLTAVGRFLHVKREWAELDGGYRHGVESLLTYARWMADNEYPYLDKPEILEYPNETWSAQDLRKGVVLMYAAGFARGKEQQNFAERANIFLKEGFSRLLSSNTYHYTRPLALVLQNGWAVEALADGPPCFPEAPRNIDYKGRPIPRLTLVEVLLRSLKDIAAVLPRTNLQREWRWLKARLVKE